MSVDEKTCFPPLNDDNYMEWSNRMEAELICKGLWDNIQCKVSVEGKPAQEAEEIVTKWHRKREDGRVEDSQLAHICDCDPEIL